MNDGFAIGIFFCRDSTIMFKANGPYTWWFVEDFELAAANE